MVDFSGAVEERTGDAVQRVALRGEFADGVFNAACGTEVGRGGLGNRVGEQEGFGERLLRPGQISGWYDMAAMEAAVAEIRI